MTFLLELDDEVGAWDAPGECDTCDQRRIDGRRLDYNMRDRPPAQFTSAAEAGSDLVAQAIAAAFRDDVPRFE